MDVKITENNRLLHTNASRVSLFLGFIPFFSFKLQQNEETLLNNFRLERLLIRNLTGFLCKNLKVVLAPEIKFSLNFSISLC